MRKGQLCVLTGLVVLFAGFPQTLAIAEVGLPEAATVSAPFLGIVKKHPSLSSELADAAEANRSSGLAAAEAFASDRKMQLIKGAVQVVVQTTAEHVALIRNQIEALGGTFELATGDLLLATVPLPALESLASAGEVKVVRRPDRLALHTATSEGVEVIGAVSWHAAGWKGAGVKVAILDRGFAGYRSLIGDELPDMPASNIKSFTGDISGGGEDHGAAVAEIVYDVAPEAELYLVNVSNDVELERAVEWLIDQQVHVINASGGFPCGGPLNGTGRINEIVQRAADAGILWVASAGNYAQRHWSGEFRDSDGDGWHNFTPGENGNAVFMNAGDELTTCVTWNDWTQKNQDFDLYVWNQSGSVIASSRDTQNGSEGHHPRESLTFTADASGYYFIGIHADRASRTPSMHLYAYPPGEECAVESIAGLAGVDRVVADVRAFRHSVLAESQFGRNVIATYQRHSAELRSILLSHPDLAIRAARVLRASMPAMNTLTTGRAGNVADEFTLSREFVDSIERLLADVIDRSSPSLRDALSSLRVQSALSTAAGQTVSRYWEALVIHDSSESSVGGAASHPEAGYMRHVSAAMSLAPPADSPYALTVGAADWSTDQPEEFSSQGPTSDGRLKPDISAPNRVCTLTLGKCESGGFAGTSAAAPHVAGAAALVKQADFSRNAAQLRHFLSTRAVDLPPAGPDYASGAGRVALGGNGLMDPLPAPVLWEPKGDGVPGWPTFSWSVLPAAPAYRVMVSRNAGDLPRDPGAMHCGGCVINSTTSTNYFTSSVPLQVTTTYHWQVQGLSSSRVGIWSAPQAFTTAKAAEEIPPERVNLTENAGPWPAAARKAIVVTHGWKIPIFGNEFPWLDEMAEVICVKLGAPLIRSRTTPGIFGKVCQSNGWDVWIMDWQDRAETPWPWHAYVNAIELGEVLASSLDAKRYEFIHFIAHSAGSNLIDFATARLKDRRGSSVQIHETFLDPYDPSRGQSRYGSRADWADNYVDTRDVGDFFLGFDGTELFLENAYNIDVTPAGGDPCVYSFAAVFSCRHGRPYRFYGHSIDASFVGDRVAALFDPVAGAAGMGFPLSNENGNMLQSLNSSYPRKGKCVIRENVCSGDVLAPGSREFRAAVVTGHVNTTVGTVSWLLDFTAKFVFEMLKLGVVLVSGTSEGVQAEATPESAETESPSWITVDVNTAESVETIRFRWRFGPGGEGVLRIAVNGMLVRQIDQRYVPAGPLQTEDVYVGGALGFLPPGTHRIAFRLDGFGSGASGVEIEAIEMGVATPGPGRRRLVRR